MWVHKTGPYSYALFDRLSKVLLVRIVKNMCSLHIKMEEKKVKLHILLPIIPNG